MPLPIATDAEKSVLVIRHQIANLPAHSIGGAALRAPRC